MKLRLESRWLATGTLLTLLPLLQGPGVFASGAGAQRVSCGKRRRGPSSKTVTRRRALAGKAADPDQPVHDGPLDELQRALASRHSKPAEQLRKAWEALKRTDYTGARKLAAVIRREAEFGDYARWISATADLTQAVQSLANNRDKDAARLARSAVVGLTGLDAAYPYSPLLKRVNGDLAQAELIQARVVCSASKKPGAPCREIYERAFERVVGTTELVLLLPRDLETYSSSCARGRTELCNSWLERLGQLYARGTIEYRALAKPFPKFADLFPRPGYFGKGTQSYKAPDLDQSAFDAALMLYMEHKYGDASGAFLRFLDEFPRSRSRFRARYWLAQAMLQDKKKDESVKQLHDLQQGAPLTWYGLLASLDSGAPIDGPLTEGVPPGSDHDPFLSPMELFRLRRAEKLLAGKASDLAAIELRDVKSHETLSSEYLMYLVLLQVDARNYMAAFPIVNDLVARNARGVRSPYLARLIFPVEQWGLVSQYAIQNKLDPLLVLCLMKQESSFDATAISPVGALGLMQLMPSTAAAVMPDQPRSELARAETNIRTGSKYLGKLLAHFNGNIALALAAYNAGPGAVDRWMRANPDRSLTEFIELIPYVETREYVAGIIRNYFWYAHKFNPDTATKLTLNYFWSDSRTQPPVYPTEAVMAVLNGKADPDLLFTPATFETALPAPGAGFRTAATRQSGASLPAPASVQSPAPDSSDSQAPSVFHGAGDDYEPLPDPPAPAGN